MPTSEEKDRALARLINVYLTPYAVFLVLMGVLSTGLNGFTEAAIGVVVFTGLVNAGLTALNSSRTIPFQILRSARSAFNYFFNIILVFLLWPAWKSAWILFLLCLFPVAFFEDRKTVAGTAALFSIALLFIQYTRGEFSRVQTCEILFFCASLWTFAFLIRRIVRLVPSR